MCSRPHPRTRALQAQRVRQEPREAPDAIAQEGSRAKVYYIGPNFRYERPQKGRFRIHHQFGAEAFGIAAPEQDVECILLQMDFYRRCGVKDLSLRINSLGDGESKQRYRDELVKFLSPKSASLTSASTCFCI